MSNGREGWGDFRNCLTIHPQTILSTRTGLASGSLFSGSVGIGGSVVEFSPATRETRVRFPANACRLGGASERSASAARLRPQRRLTFLTERALAAR